MPSSAGCRQAVVLVGGEGTRLRPITSRVPKPVAPVVERPFVSYILENLVRHGVERAVFSSGFLAHAIKDRFGDGAAYGLAIEYVVEDEPLGTAGAIKNVAAALEPGSFFVFNGDVLTDVDLTALAARHRARGAAATIFLTPVDDPRRYCLVELRADDSVAEFIEKPSSDRVGRALINAGVYVLEHEVLELIPPGRMFSIERGVFPKLAQDGSLYGYVESGYWRDIGTPESYLQAHFDILDRNVQTSVGDLLGESYVYVAPSAELAKAARVIPPCYIAENVSVAEGARVGPLAVLGAGVSVGEGAVVTEAVLQAGVSVGRDCIVKRSVIVSDAAIGAGTQVSEAVVGAGCRIGAGNELAMGISLFPGTDLPDGSMKFREVGESREGR
jgi:mannose-1-phosphate guanylyltransferase